jgi:hypothetical protein
VLVLDDLPDSRVERPEPADHSLCELRPALVPIRVAERPRPIADSQRDPIRAARVEHVELRQLDVPEVRLEVVAATAFEPADALGPALPHEVDARRARQVARQRERSAEDEVVHREDAVVGAPLAQPWPRVRPEEPARLLGAQVRDDSAVRPQRLHGVRVVPGDDRPDARPALDDDLADDGVAHERSAGRDERPLERLDERLVGPRRDRGAERERPEPGERALPRLQQVSEEVQGRQGGERPTDVVRREQLLDELDARRAEQHRRRGLERLGAQLDGVVEGGPIRVRGEDRAAQQPRSALGQAAEDRLEGVGVRRGVPRQLRVRLRRIGVEDGLLATRVEHRERHLGHAERVAELLQPEVVDRGRETREVDRRVVEPDAGQEVVREVEAPGIDSLLDERDACSRLLEVGGRGQPPRQARPQDDDVELSHAPCGCPAGESSVLQPPVR